MSSSRLVRLLSTTTPSVPLSLVFFADSCSIGNEAALFFPNIAVALFGSLRDDSGEPSLIGDETATPRDEALRYEPLNVGFHVPIVKRDVVDDGTREGIPESLVVESSAV